MFRLKDKKFPKNTSITISYCTPAIIIFIGLLFVTSFREATNLSFALASTFGRYIFGLFIGSVVAMFHFGYGGILNTFFSHKFFVHLNKTTYIMYLIHPIVILFLNSTQEASPHFDVPILVS